MPAQPAEAVLLVMGSGKSGPPDAQLVAAALGGHTGAAAKIWERYVVLVRGILRRSLGAHDVEDHTQDVFMRLFDSLPQLRDPTALKSFVFGIALRVAGTELRRRRMQWWLRLTPTGAPADCQLACHDDPEAKVALGRLYAILDQLGTRARLAFVLRYIEGMELTEVAAALNISLATTKRQLARAASRVFAMVERDPALAEYVQEPGKAKREGHSGEN
jgi:RNA polymerase sigma-70 factor, ECF subfamily